MKELMARSFCCQYSCFPVSRPPVWARRRALDHRYFHQGCSWKHKHSEDFSFRAQKPATKTHSETNRLLLDCSSFWYYNSTLYCNAGKEWITNGFSSDHPSIYLICGFVAPGSATLLLAPVPRPSWFLFALKRVLVATVGSVSDFFGFSDLLLMNYWF